MFTRTKHGCQAVRSSRTPVRHHYLRFGEQLPEEADTRSLDHRVLGPKYYNIPGIWAQYPVVWVLGTLFYHLGQGLGFRDYVGSIMVYWGYIEIMEKKMETTF